AERLVRSTCETLATGTSAAGLRAWTEAFHRFLQASGAPLADFVAAEGVVQEGGADFLELLSAFGEAAVRGGQAEPFYRAVQAGADGTGLVALRFLAAWTALNRGALASCIEECDKVDQPYAAIFTLQGQALVELLRPRDAVHVLQTAVEL